MHPYDNAEALLRVLREPRRNHFFYGKRMDVQHFRMEQDYGKLKQWLLNRLTLGKGVLCGLRVSVVDGRLCVDPGVAIDGLGREIIVPIRYCVDPVVLEEDCCSGAHRPPTPTPTPTPAPTPNVAGAGGATPAPTATPMGGPLTRGPRDAGQPQVEDGIFTLWLCYRECLTDHQPVLVTECGTRDECSPGTVVETFCLKFLPGLAAPQGDPEWCARLWDLHDKPGTPAPSPAPGTPSPAPAPLTSGSNFGGLSSVGTNLSTAGAGSGLTADERERAARALRSRRHLLCELFDADCDPSEGDPCVPIAAVAIREGRIVVETCLVRPRIYSNQRLLDLILCLADRIEECCEGHAQQPLQVRSVEFLRRDDTGETAVTSITTALQDTPVAINGRTNAIRIRFTRPLDTGAERKPATHGLNDASFDLRNVRVLPDDPLNNAPFVPGTLQLEQPDTVRFDLFPDSPYARGNDGWQKGRYRILLAGDDTPQGRKALAERDSGAHLDGEAVAPAGGVLSGKDGPGGDFSAPFVVGAGPAPSPAPTPTPTPTPAPTPAPTPTPSPPARLMHVRSVEFLGVQRGGANTRDSIGRIDTPLQATRLQTHLGAIRIVFDKPYAPTGSNMPTVGGLNEAQPLRHNIQLRPAQDIQDRFGTRHIAARLTQEDARTVLLEIEPGTRLVNADGRWLVNQRINCLLFIRGDIDAASGFPFLADVEALALDGEPKAPAAGVMSGNGAAGGDFRAPFEIFIPG